MPHRIIAAIACLSALVGCQEPRDDQFTMVPVTVNDPFPVPGPVGDGGQPPGRADAALDAAGDGGDAGDGALLADGGALDDGGLDAHVDAGPDAAPDAGPARPICQDDRDCALAVQLDRCDPCPTAAHVDEIADDRCLVPYALGAILGAYAPADCWADCGEAIGAGCFDDPVAAVCEPPRQPGVCALFR